MEPSDEEWISGLAAEAEPDGEGPDEDWPRARRTPKPRGRLGSAGFSWWVAVLVAIAAAAAGVALALLLVPGHR